MKTGGNVCLNNRKDKFSGKKVNLEICKMSKSVFVCVLLVNICLIFLSLVMYKTMKANDKQQSC